MNVIYHVEINTNLMKKVSLLLISSLFLITSCRYEDASFSFKSPESRLIGYWLLQETFLNDVSMDTVHYEAYYPELNVYYFFYDGPMSVSSYVGNALTESTSSGSWDFKDKKRTLDINFTLFNKRYRYDAEIVKLSERELIYRYTDSFGDKWELHFYKRYSY